VDHLIICDLKNKIMKRISVIAIALLLFGCNSTQKISDYTTTPDPIESKLLDESKKEKLDNLFKLLEENDKAMGTIALLNKGKIVYTNSIGYADVESEIASNNNTKFRIGSISKMFTASLIMKAIEEGKLSLGVQLSEYFPNVPNSDEITIEHLLRHRSGIYNFTNAEDYSKWETNEISKEDLIAKIISYGSSFEPDTKADYSNSNYVILTFILEEIFNKKFGDIVKTDICLPCKLSDTYVGQKISADNNEAYSYQKLDKWKKTTETDMSIPTGAGAIVSTPSELVKFLNCLYVDKKIVTQTSLNKMTKIEEGYGIGMIEVPFYDKKGLGHTGGIDGFRANAFHFPADNFSIAYCSNGVDYSLNDIMIGVLSIYFDKDYKIPSFKTYDLKAEDLEKYLGTFSSPTFPLKIAFTKDGNRLIAQATGQSAFPLDAVDKDKFKFDGAGIEIDFNPSGNEMVLRQGGGEYKLKKE